MAVTKIGSGLVVRDEFERAFPTSGQASVAAFPGANLKIAGAIGSRYLTSFPEQRNTYAFITQGKGLNDFVIEARVKNTTIEERTGVIFRGFVPGVDMFELRLEHDQSVGKNPQLVLYGPSGLGLGGMVKLGAVAAAWAVDTWYHIKAEVKGNSIRAWFDAGITDVADISYNASYDLPLSYGMFGVTGGTFLGSGGSLNSWDYVRVQRSNRIRMEGLPASHKLEIAGVVGPVAVDGIAYLDFRGAGNGWSPTVHVLDGSNTQVASYGPLPVDPGDVFLSGLVTVPGATQFYEDFGTFAAGAELGSPKFSAIAYLSSIFGPAAPWVIRSGMKGSVNNRVLKPAGTWGTTSMRWLGVGNGSSDQELLIRFRKQNNPGYMARLRSNTAQTRGIQFGLQPDFVRDDTFFNVGLNMPGFSASSYRLFAINFNSDGGPWPPKFSDSIQLFDGQSYFIRMKVSGGNALARVWKTDEEEPGVWQLQATVDYTSAGYIDLNAGSFGLSETAIDTLSAGLDGYPAQNHDALFVIPSVTAVPIVPGAQRLTIFEDDDKTPILGKVDPRDGTILEATVSTHPNDPRPYLNPVDEHSDSQIALTEGNSSVGQLNFSLGDKRTVPTDQTTGWFTAILDKGILNHRAVFQEMTKDGDWETIIDGVCGPPQLEANLVMFSGLIKDIRERERNVRVFTKTFFSVLPYGLPDGYGLVTEETTPIGSPDVAFFADNFDGDGPGSLLQDHLDYTQDPPVTRWLRHPNFASDMKMSNTGRVYTLGIQANYFVNLIPASADYEVVANIWKRSDGTGTIGVLLRDDPTATNYYYFYYDDAANRFALNRNLGGTTVTIGSFAFDLLKDTVVEIKIRGVGTSIECYVDGAKVIAVVDANISAVNRGGIRSSIMAASEDTGLQIDDFRINDLTSIVSKSQVNGSLLVRPVMPLIGKFYAQSGNPNKGAFEILWKSSTVEPGGTTFNDDSWSKYSQDHFELLTELNYASSVFNKNLGDFELRHQGVLIRWTDKWESNKPIRWRYLRDMKLGDVELFVTNENNWAIIGVDENFKLLQVLAQCDDINQLPANNQQVYFEVVSEREPSEDTPLMFTENLGRLAQRIYDGEFRDVDSLIIPYDRAAMVRFILDTPVTNVKITAPWENMWDDLAQNIYRPTGYVPVTDGTGLVSPKSVDLPDPKIDLPIITDELIEGESARWLEGDEDLITIAEFHYFRDFLAPQIPNEPKTDYERLRERPVILARVAPSYILHKEHKITYEQDTIRSVTLSNFGAGEIAHEVGAQLGGARLRGSLSRFSNGAERCSIIGKLSSPVIAGLRKGDWANLQISWMPDKLTQKRGLNRVMQIIQMKRLSSLKVQMLFVDAGPYNTPAPSATVTTLATKGERRITANVTVVPNIDGKPVTVVLQYALNPVGLNADTADTRWVTFSEDTKVGVKTSQPLPQATKALVRYRSEFAGSRPSKWVTTSAVTLGDVAVASDLNTTFPADPTQAHANFTPPDALVSSNVYLRLTEQPESKYVLIGTAAPGSGEQTLLLTSLIPSIAYTFAVRSVDPGTGDLSPLVEADFIASDVVAALPVPKFLTPFTLNFTSIVSGLIGKRAGQSGINGVYGMAVFAAILPSQVEFQQAIETGIGSGVYGPWLPMQAPVDSVQGDWTTAGDRATTNDRKRRQMRARHIREGATNSAWTATVIVMPYTSVPLNSLAQALDVFYEKSGGTISGSAHVDGTLTAEREVFPVGVDKWAVE